jgi:hypothetical protein
MLIQLSHSEMAYTQTSPGQQHRSCPQIIGSPPQSCLRHVSGVPLSLMITAATTAARATTAVLLPLARPSCLTSLQTACVNRSSTSSCHVDSVPEGAAHVPAAASATQLAVITGASRGLGFHIARQLMLQSAGAGGKLDLVLLAKCSTRLHAAAELLQQLGRDANAGVEVTISCHSIDLGDMAQLEQALPKLATSKRKVSRGGV